MTVETEKLQKVLARAGLGSRRAIEGWIEEGRITIDGRTAKLGDRVTGQERLEVDGRRISERKLATTPIRVIAYHKPEGELVTRDDPERRGTVFTHLPALKSGRWIAIGRLDLNTSGLLLFTTDGELANALMHPSRRVEREYAVRVHGDVAEDALVNMTRGVELDDGPARFEEITDAGGRGTNHWYYVTIVEGRKREVRRLWESQGVQVSRLMRVRFGPYQLPPGLRKGRWRELNPDQIDRLRETVDMPPLKSSARPSNSPARQPRRKPTTGPSASSREHATGRSGPWKGPRK